MAKRRMKAYMPPWIGWVLIPLFIAIWGVVTWMVWLSGEPRDSEDVAGWWMTTIVLLVVSGLILAMASGKLPAYVIEVEEDED